MKKIFYNYDKNFILKVNYNPLKIFDLNYEIIE